MCRLREGGDGGGKSQSEGVERGMGGEMRSGRSERGCRREAQRARMGCRKVREGGEDDVPRGAGPLNFDLMGRTDVFPTILTSSNSLNVE